LACKGVHPVKGSSSGLKEKTMYDIANNPIPKSDMWATKSIAEIQDFIDMMPSDQRASCCHILMWTLNACHKLVQDEILDREIFGG
jgi:hypothetical protein